MTAKPNKFDWLNEVAYEPAPLPAAYGRTRAPLTLRVFIVCAALAVICGALAAFNN